ncbi:Tetrapeptide transporter [Parasponia andersonii]|uniref:Tetrapeptide transporter n=1 Tax=Parasponia andersonii TaxID=3476 RepID=A0A2P5CEZ7_PARAD|nr:Tetrapeptide transporter [Parasponia andersonii]
MAETTQEKEKDQAPEPEAAIKEIKNIKKITDAVDNPIDEDELSPVEEVRLTVPNTDDTSLPVWTFRMWSLGLVSCTLLSFLNQFFSYRTEPLVVTQITVLVATLPVGRFMAAVLPETKFRIPGLGPREFSLNPGPFNIKEHVLISIFANAGSAFGNGSAYAIMIVDIIKAFYVRKISFLAGWLLIITTQVLGYGWAGLLRKYVVEPSHMWWPSTLVQISLFRTLHEKEEVDRDNKHRISRAKFFVIALICSFCWYVFPGYLFQTLQSISWVCWAFPNSVTAHQIGSGLKGLGLGAFTMDWSTVASFLFSPLICPFFAIVNVFVGYVLIIYLVIPVSYWGFNVFSATKFPIFSADLFTGAGQPYNVSLIVNKQFELDDLEYAKQGRVHLSTFFALTYGFGFATIASTLTHVALFHGRIVASDQKLLQLLELLVGIWRLKRLRELGNKLLAAEIYDRYRASVKGKDDIHTRLMKNYQDIPSWWFYLLLAVTITVSLALCIFLKKEVQLPYWGLLFAAALAFIFTLPVSIITATTNQTPGLNIITEYVMGIIYPGRPIANVSFKTYGYMSMSQAISFLSDFKLGHYMKIPPRSMFLVQFIGTMLAGTVNMSVAWWLLNTVPNICHDGNDTWACPSDNVFFDASVIWGLVGPRRIFGSLGEYPSLNWFFLGGILGPFLVWFFHKLFPNQTWIPYINLPVLLGATASMPPARPLNYTSWILVGTIFNFFVFRYRKKWWQRYNYVLSAALDGGVAFMAVLLYFSLGVENKALLWWGSPDSNTEHCHLATCPTAKGVYIKDSGCPIF